MSVKKVVVLLLLLISLLKTNQSIAQVPLPQLQAGVYVNDSLFSFYYCFVGYCDALGDVIMSMDTNLISYFSGVQFQLIVVSLTTPPDSVYTLQNGILHLGDTLTFTSLNSYFSFYASAYGCAIFKLMINGIPTIPFENYPCEIGAVCTLSDCFNTCYTNGDTTNWCIVNDFNGINEPGKDGYIKLSPNPFINEITFKIDNGDVSEIIFRDIAARKIMQRKFTNSVSLNTEQLAMGLYIYEVWSKNGLYKKGKVVKN